MQHEERLRHFTEAIWQWYAKNKRVLPWRDLEIPDDAQRAYMILVSEVMLQQTQVPRVQVLFPRFLQKFPTIHHLAKASNRDVLIAWRGMGYNGRALRLRDAARMIVGKGSVTPSVVEEGHGKHQHNDLGFDYAQPDTRAMSRYRKLRECCSFPREMSDLLQIPGIGPYTAAAIRNFAFGVPTPCVDTNIERILARVFGMKGKKRVGERAGEVLRVAWEYPSPPQGGGERGGGKAAQWHSALMDFGSLVCMKRKPLCSQCPLSQEVCKSAFRVSSLDDARDDTRNEPGRTIAGRFVPNRIVRGKIVDLLRDHPQGLTLARIGRKVCVDWSEEHRSWLQSLIKKLVQDVLVTDRRRRYALRE